jgi:hypothetical protein
MSSASIESKFGVSISEEGFAILKDEIENMEAKSIENYLLESDIKQLVTSLFSPVLSDPSQPGKMLAQLGKVVDISRPIGPGDAEEDDDEDDISAEIGQKNGNRRIPSSRKRILKLNVFTIGGSKFEFIEIEKIPDKFCSVPPGTKVLLNGPFQYMAGFYLLNRPGQIEILGGHVKRLADGWDMGNRVKEARKNTGVTSGGPPKFVSFFDRHKIKEGLHPSQPSQTTTTSPSVPSAVPTRSIAPDIQVSDKSAALSKLSSDAFAMKTRGKGKREGRHSRRREEDELIAQYKPPPVAAPQLAEFARIDKCDSLVGAQLLAESHPVSGKGRGQPRQDPQKIGSTVEEKSQFQKSAPKGGKGKSGSKGGSVGGKGSSGGTTSGKGSSRGKSGKGFNSHNSSRQ